MLHAILLTTTQLFNEKYEKNVDGIIYLYLRY